MTEKQEHLLIRADATPTMGAGHIMRCLALAQAWQDLGGEVTFFCAELPDPLESRLDKERINVERCDSVSGSSEDASATLELGRKLKSLALVIDGYQFGQCFQDTVSRFPGASLTIDDYGHLNRYRTTFVLNQNHGANAQAYSNRDKNTRLLLGTEFALIRREFLEAKGRNRIRDGKINNILVTLGGSDPSNMLETILQALKQLPQSHLQFRVIAGPLNQNLSRLQSIADTDQRIELISSVEDMSTAYTWADLAIAAAGSTNWEMCCFGLPRILITLADNQEQIAKMLLDEQVSLWNFHAGEVACNRLLEVFDASMCDEQAYVIASKKARKFASELGAESVADLLVLNAKIIVNKPGVK